MRRGRHTEPAFIICLEPSFVLSRPPHRMRQLTQRALLSQATRLIFIFCFCYTAFGTWRSRFGLRRRFTFRQPRTPSQRPHDKSHLLKRSRVYRRSLTLHRKRCFFSLTFRGSSQLTRNIASFFRVVVFAYSSVKTKRDTVTNVH